MYQYFVKVVPTVYKDLGGKVHTHIHTYIHVHMCCS